MAFTKYGVYYGDSGRDYFRVTGHVCARQYASEYSILDGVGDHGYYYWDYGDYVVGSSGDYVRLKSPGSDGQWYCPKSYAAYYNKTLIEFNQNTTSIVNNMPSTGGILYSDTTYKLPSNTPTCTGYKFLGWTLAAQSIGPKKDGVIYLQPGQQYLTQEEINILAKQGTTGKTKVMDILYKKYGLDCYVPDQSSTELNTETNLYAAWDYNGIVSVCQSDGTFKSYLVYIYTNPKSTTPWTQVLPYIYTGNTTAAGATNGWQPGIGS